MNSCPTCGHIIPGQTEPITVGIMTLRPRSYTADIVGVKLLLSRQTFRILVALAKYADGICSHDAIFEEVYWDRLDATEPKPNILKVQIFHLRKKLAPFGITIRNVWGRGYELSVPEKVAA